MQIQETKEKRNNTQLGKAKQKIQNDSKGGNSITTRKFEQLFLSYFCFQFPGNRGRTYAPVFPPSRPRPPRPSAAAAAAQHASAHPLPDHCHVPSPVLSALKRRLFVPNSMPARGIGDEDEGRDRPLILGAGGKGGGGNVQGSRLSSWGAWISPTAACIEKWT